MTWPEGAGTGPPVYLWGKGQLAAAPLLAGSVSTTPIFSCILAFLTSPRAQEKKARNGDRGASGRGVN